MPIIRASTVSTEKYITSQKITFAQSKVDNQKWHQTRQQIVDVVVVKFILDNGLPEIGGFQGNVILVVRVGEPLKHVFEDVAKVRIKQITDNHQSVERLTHVSLNLLVAVLRQRKEQVQKPDFAAHNVFRHFTQEIVDATKRNCSTQKASYKQPNI